MTTATRFKRRLITASDRHSLALRTDATSRPQCGECASALPLRPLIVRRTVAEGPLTGLFLKEQILAIYGEMAECIAKGTEWKSPLDPPGRSLGRLDRGGMEMRRAGRGDEIIEKYALLDDSDPDQDAEAEYPPGAEAVDWKAAAQLATREYPTLLRSPPRFSRQECHR